MNHTHRRFSQCQGQADWLSSVDALIGPCSQISSPIWSEMTTDEHKKLSVRKFPNRNDLLRMDKLSNISPFLDNLSNSCYLFSALDF